MKIGIDVSAAFGWRGLARYTQNIVKALMTIDQENSYFLFASMPLEKYFTIKNNANFIVVPKIKGVPWLNVSLPLAVRRFDLDVFFFPANDFWLWKPMKTVVAYHDGSYQLFPKQMFKNRLEELYFRLQMKRLPLIADSLITVSQHSAGLLGKNLNIPVNKVHVVPNGLDPVFLDGSIKPRAGLGDYILFVGGFEFRKNLERLLGAFKKLKQTGLKEKLILVGSSASNSRLYLDVPKLIAKYELENEVQIMGKSSSDRELVSLYKGARLFVFPSVIESFGMPLLEAMACGCPVAASSAGAIPEVAGDAAILFDPINISEMADKISLLLTDDNLRLELISKGRERAKLFSWEESARKLLKILRGL